MRSRSGRDVSLPGRAAPHALRGARHHARSRSHPAGRSQLADRAGTGGLRGDSSAVRLLRRRHERVTAALGRPCRRASTRRASYYSSPDAACTARAPQRTRHRARRAGPEDRRDDGSEGEPDPGVSRDADRLDEDGGAVKAERGELPERRHGEERGAADHHHEGERGARGREAPALEEGARPALAVLEVLLGEPSDESRGT